MDYHLLVNKQKGLDENYVPSDIVEVSSLYKDNILLEKETYNNFLELRKEVLNSGYQMEVESGYRDFEYQRRIYNELIEEKGYDYAIKYIALPGHSEHQTGLCLDFCLYKDDVCILEHDLKELDIIKHIHDILHIYGFILRYPLDKEKITGYNYEPWHIRYVGKDLAKYLYDNNLTLDEYYYQI